MMKPARIIGANMCWQGFFAVALALSLLCASNAVLAHGDEDHAANVMSKKEQTDWGIAGNAKGARTVKIRMLDTMRFVPEQIAVKEGETIRFVIANEGQMLHEFVLGTSKVLDQHAAMMASNPEMAHVAAGKSKELVWTFNRSGDFDFACLIAGHYQAGMRGLIIVSDK